MMAWDFLNLLCPSRARECRFSRTTLGVIMWGIRMGGLSGCEGAQ